MHFNFKPQGGATLVGKALCYECLHKGFDLEFNMDRPTFDQLYGND